MFAIGKESFSKAWTARLWHAMSITGKGYRPPSLRNTGRGDDRRADKRVSRDDSGQIVVGEYAGWPKAMRSYSKRYSRA